jgi:hypothetical protein
MTIDIADATHSPKLVIRAVGQPIALLLRTGGRPNGLPLSASFRDKCP